MSQMQMIESVEALIVDFVSTLHEITEETIKEAIKFVQQQVNDIKNDINLSEEQMNDRLTREMVTRLTPRNIP